MGLVAVVVLCELRLLRRANVATLMEAMLRPLPVWVLEVMLVVMVESLLVVDEFLRTWLSVEVVVLLMVGNL